MEKAEKNGEDGHNRIKRYNVGKNEAQKNRTENDRIKQIRTA